MKRKIAIFFIGLSFLFAILFLLRTNILKGLADYLIVETSFDKVAYAFVLSGNALDRCGKAAELYHQGKVAAFVCTGANQSNDLKSLGIDTLESDLSELQLIKNGVPSALIIKIKIGTSTMEEANWILSFCQEKQLKEILIVSSKFHTRRVHQVFTKAFAEEGIQVHIAGAPSSQYDEMEWWKSEYGLIALNNEYLKQLYYLINY